jgi:hypothetical protein
MDEINENILFPDEGAEGGLCWWACPEGLNDHDDRPVSGGLRQREDLNAIDALRRVTELADQLVNDAPPPGVSERTNRRMLLEAKIRAYDLIAATRTGARAHQARRESAAAFDELMRWHRADVRDRLGHIAYCDTEAVITYDGRPVQLLQRHDDPADEHASGWLLCSLGDQSNSQPLTGPQLPAALDATILAVGGLYDEELIVGVDAPQTMALAAALDRVCDHVASDAAKGHPPFAPGGIAGPPTS